MAEIQSILHQIQQLNTSEQLRLLEELASLVRCQIEKSNQHSILELKGLGKEIWKNIDVQKYIEEERNSWDG